MKDINLFFQTESMPMSMSSSKHYCCVMRNSCGSQAKKRRTERKVLQHFPLVHRLIDPVKVFFREEGIHARLLDVTAAAPPEGRDAHQSSVAQQRTSRIPLQNRVRLG